MNYGLTSSGATTGSLGGELVAVKVERPLLETVAITADRLQAIERRMHRLEGILFGSGPAASDMSVDGQKSVPNVLESASDAFRTSARIQEFLDNLIQRIEG